jgi:hypothetical protein
MTYLHIPLDAYDKLLDCFKLIQMDVCDFVVYLRKKGLSSSSYVYLHTLSIVFHAV